MSVDGPLKIENSNPERKYVCGDVGAGDTELKTENESPAAL
jgi:hypothetical protein